MTNEALRKLCIENDWFTCGSNEQYEKLFILNADGIDGVSNEKLALLIFICSSGYSLEEIEKILKQADLPQLDLTYLMETLRHGHWGEQEIGLIYLAVHGSEDNGTMYNAQ